MTYREKQIREAALALFKPHEGILGKETELGHEILVNCFVGGAQFSDANPPAHVQKLVGALEKISKPLPDGMAYIAWAVERGALAREALAQYREAVKG